MDATVEIIATQLENIKNFILDYALLLAAVGVMAMVLVELIKGVGNLRRIYHQIMFHRWIKSRGGEQKEQAILEQLLKLAVGGSGDKNIFFNQPTGKMMGQLQAAVNVIMDYPHLYPDFYHFLTTVSSRKKGEKESTNTVLEESADWMQFNAELAERIGTSGYTPPVDEELRRVSQLRTRLNNFVTRRLDAFQNRLELVWARLNQIVAIIIASAVLLYVFCTTEITQQFNVGELIILALLGGVISPFAKDVVNGLSKIRLRRQ